MSIAPRMQVPLYVGEFMVLDVMRGEALGIQTHGFSLDVLLQHQFQDFVSVMRSPKLEKIVHLARLCVCVRTCVGVLVSVCVCVYKRVRMFTVVCAHTCTCNGAGLTLQEAGFDLLALLITTALEGKPRWTVNRI